MFINYYMVFLVSSKVIINSFYFLFDKPKLSLAQSAHLDKKFK